MRHAELDQVRQLRLDCRRLEEVNAQLRRRIEEKEALIDRLVRAIVSANAHRLAGLWRRAMWWIREAYNHGASWLQDDSGGEEDDLVVV